MAEPNQALTQSKHGYAYGDVDIAPGVAIAAGVLLGAAPGCRLVISAGACLGADVVIRVSRGTLVVEPGANLGSGVLVVGQGRIGHHACIGANSTIINPQVDPHQVVAPKALLGDPSRPQACPGAVPGFLSPESRFSSNGRAVPGNVTESGPVSEMAAMAPDADTSNAVSGVSLNGRQSSAESAGVTEPVMTVEDHPESEAASEVETNQMNGATPPSPAESSAVEEPLEEPLEDKSLTNVTHVYGKKQVSQLLATLFPHRHPLNGSAPENKT